MNVIFEIDPNDEKTITLIKKYLPNCKEESSNGLDGNTVIALIGVFTPVIVQLILELCPKYTVSYEINGIRQEISSRFRKKAEKQMEDLIKAYKREKGE